VSRRGEFGVTRNANDGAESRPVSLALPLLALHGGLSLLDRVLGLFGREDGDDLGLHEWPQGQLREQRLELRMRINVPHHDAAKWRDEVALWQARYHLGNWLDCIKTRQKPVADVEIGHRSISVCHLANIARDVGRKLQWDPAKEQFVGDDEANTYVTRPRRKGYELPDPV